MDLPVSPGPAAYEVPRVADPVPEWGSSSLMTWGLRTEDRPDMKNASWSDVGPGDHIADHPFKASRPSCIFGHPLRKPTRDNYPDPGAYDLQGSIGDGPSYSVGPGQRTHFQ